MPWPPHRTLYELGRGGMGVVELAEVDSGLVAVKRILPYRAGDAKTRSSFLREARLLARIDHPNVVRALGVDEGQGDEPPALMMQYVAGVPLKDLLAESPEGLPVPVAARLGLEVARGLHAAHELCDESGRRLGVVHRDVSPHNVLVTFDGRAVLLDFGVAKMNDATRTVTGEVKGKLAYMAPEQAMADPVDRRGDIYALGAILFEMLSGRRMHGEGTDLEILKRMISERPPPLRERRPDLPEGLDQLVARMTAESPERRPSTGDEVAAALEPFAAGAGPSEVAAYIEQRLPDARRLHDERLAEARAAALRPAALPRAAGAPPALEERLAGPSTQPPTSEKSATSRPTQAATPAFGGARPSVPAPPGPRAEGPSSAALERPAPPGRQAPSVVASSTRWVAVLLGISGLGFGVFGVASLLGERRSTSATPAVDTASPPTAAASSAAAPSASPPSTPSAVASQSATGDATSAVPSGARPPKRVRSPRRPPPASPGAISGAPARPPPLPVDAGAIGDDG